MAAGCGNGGRDDGGSVSMVSPNPDGGAPDTGAPDTGAPGPGSLDAGIPDAGPLPPLVDNAAVYDPGDYDLVTLNITVPDAATLANIEQTMSNAEVPAVFSAPDYPSDGTTPNAELQLHGSTSRSAIQKSYQIHLAKTGAAWRGSHTVNLLKHPFDLTRVRNSVSFDEFRSISNFTSLRQGWVHLYINAIDHGLYQWLEEPDTDFLTAHGLDPQGTLYKSETFAFQPVDPAVATDPKMFALLVEAKGTPAVAKLVQMAAAVNDPSQNINDVIARWFNRDNYLTWLAVNMLMTNYDTNTQNFILYSPSGYAGWYFLPWDYDGAWDWNDQPGEPALPRTRQGLSNWWTVTLHSRFLSDPNNLADLDARIQALAGTINDSTTAALMAGYHDLVQSYISVEPDLDNLPCADGGTPQAVVDWQTEYTRLGSVASADLATYQATIDRPMPFWLYTPAFDDPSNPQSVTLSWGASAQLHQMPFTYQLDVNTLPTFDPSGAVLSQPGIAGPLVTITTLPSGTYYWRVTASVAADPTDDWQTDYMDQTLTIP
ncbi:MAG TPA: CotH kinase family protein [Polyangia bacterium]|nr:CotH kinase family protein [Polyangia bacterium]